MVFAVALAQAVGVPVEDIIRGRYVQHGVCPFCGRPGAVVQRTG